MTNQFTAFVEFDGTYYVAHCAEITGANGQGKTKAEALGNLQESIFLILEDRREDMLKFVSGNAEKSILTLV